MSSLYRHEMKYVIPESLHLELSRVLTGIMERDRHAGPSGSYHIRSLYFDDIYGTAYQEKLNGVEIRRKYRIRIYNCSDGVISLECKHKNGAYIHKEELSLSREEYGRMCRCDYDFLLRRETPLAEEFFIDARTALLRPAVIVAYDREPYVCDTGTVRITFDKNLQAISCSEDMFSPLAPGFFVLPPGHMILEVKFTGKLPEHIRRIFRSYALTQSSASKFCLCMDRLEDTFHHL